LAQRVDGALIEGRSEAAQNLHVPDRSFLAHDDLEFHVAFAARRRASSV